jgi:hypothetical protein
LAISATLASPTPRARTPALKQAIDKCRPPLAVLTAASCRHWQLWQAPCCILLSSRTPGAAPTMLASRSSSALSGGVKSVNNFISGGPRFHRLNVPLGPRISHTEFHRKSGVGLRSNSQKGRVRCARQDLGSGMCSITSQTRLAKFNGVNSA